MHSHKERILRTGNRAVIPAAAAMASFFLTSSPAHASLLKGDALDSLANAISWVVIILAPIIGITVFWLVHILPEKIAHKKQHPQTGAIQCLCLLSLCFGGLLWPIAWLWAYTKPVLHKLAYGTDVDPSLAHAHPDSHSSSSPNEVAVLQARVKELETHINGGKA